MDSLFFRFKVWVKVLFLYSFYFPGLVLHEGSHAIAAVLTLSRVTWINLFPSVEFAEDDSAYRVTYGYVKSIATYQVAYMFIGLAPFILWLIPYFIVRHLGWVEFGPLTIHWKSILQLENWWFFLILSQIIWSGFPSSQDWKVFFHGLFSVSAGVFFVAVYMLYIIATTLLSPTLRNLF